MRAADIVGRMRAAGPRRWSVSTRLALWYGSTIIALLTTFAFLTYVNFRRSLHRDFDQHLLHELSVLLPLVEHGPGGPAFSRFESMRGVAYQTDGVFGTYVRLLGPTGTVLYKSPNLVGHTLLEIVLPERPAESVTGREWEGGSIRSHYHPLFAPDGSHDGWLEVSGFEWSVQQELERLIRIFAVGILAAFLLAIAGGYALAWRSLRPVAQITRVANEIQAGSLHRRIPISQGSRDELAHLSETINALLERIESSFQRERRFTASAAHELVTPLAAIRGEIELALRSPDVPEGLGRGLGAALGDIDRMNGTIRSLLQLASVERLEQTEFRLMDAAAVVAEHLTRFEDRALVHGRYLFRDLEPGCLVMAHPEGLGRIADNLIDNAIKYTEPDGRIRVVVRRAEPWIELTVSDDGIGFGEEDTAHIFDRFYRGSGAGQRAGSGLGLAIVQAIARRFGGAAVAESAGPGTGARFTVRIPAA